MSRIGATAFAALMLVLGSTMSDAESLALDPAAGATGPLALEGGDCAGGEIYDDGTLENGYSASAATVSSFEAVMQFTPAAYPGTYDTVCVALTTTDSGGPTLDFEIEVRDDDGAGGSPGTLLGVLPVSESTIPASPAFTFYSYDITSLGISIPSGSVWIGLRWNPMAFPDRYLAADESATTPLHPGFVNFNNPSMWQPTQSAYGDSYRANLIRAIPGSLEVGSILEIPTLSETALLLLALLLAAGAVWKLRSSPTTQLPRL